MKGKGNGQRPQALVLTAGFILLAGAHEIRAESPEPDAAQATEDPFAREVWNVSFCTVGTRWCLQSADVAAPNPPMSFRLAAEADSEDPEVLPDDAVMGQAPLADEDIDHRDGSLQTRIESIEELPFVTIWASEKTRLYVGVDKDGIAGIHVGRKPP